MRRRENLGRNFRSGVCFIRCQPECRGTVPPARTPGQKEINSAHVFLINMGGISEETQVLWQYSGILIPNAHWCPLV
ncbi:hypothetical protein JZ751_025379, partial [Albula glossodonta]